MRAKTTPEARVVTPLMRPWLIQRAIIIDRPHQKGLGALIRLDYMGSAEFEWGSVPASLKRIRENVDAYTVFDLQVGKGKVLTVGCQEAMKEDVKYVLQTLAKGEAIPLKERAELFEWVHPEAKRYDPSTNFWWDIENDWMAWEKNDAFAAKLKQVIRNKPSV